MEIQFKDKIQQKKSIKIVIQEMNRILCQISDQEYIIKAVQITFFLKLVQYQNKKYIVTFLKSKQLMNFITKQYQQTKKSISHMWNPNENPTDLEKQAFKLLDRAEVDMFIELFQKNPSMNPHVVDWNKVSFLLMCLSVANRPNNMYKKLYTDDDLLQRGIKAVKFILSKGVDVDYRDKNGATALMSACHWGNYQIAKILLQHGANPHLKCEGPFNTSPLLSAYFKKKMDLVILLFKYGARVQDVQATCQKSSHGYGFQLNTEDINFLRSIGNIATLVRKRKQDQHKGKETFLSGTSDMIFQDICYNI